MAGRTQMSSVAAGFVPGPALFAVDLVQVRPLVTAATRRDALDSSRLYSNFVGFKDVAAGRKTRSRDV